MTMMTETKSRMELAIENWATIQKIAPKVTDGYDSPDEMSDDELTFNATAGIDVYEADSKSWAEGSIVDRGETDGLRWIRFDGVQPRKGLRRIESVFVIQNGDGVLVLCQH